jgi:phosphoglycolate phosphatase-like HAD superfamily hydrolase
MITVENIQSARIIFWDFDGVIKDSVTVKSDAFEQLFLPFGESIAANVRIHHEANGGLSRFNKLPIYLKWANQDLSAELIDEYAENFSQLVKQKVIDSEWVGGVLDFLKNSYHHQQFFLITATPQQEIEEILSTLKITRYFKEIVGSPIIKSEAIKKLIDRYNIIPKQSIMIGDSISDYDAAKANNLSFILRNTKFNKNLQQQINCKFIDDFL